MATSYPAALDALSNPAGTDTLDSVTVRHSTEHSNANDAIEAIQAELGLAPRGAAATVKARLDALDTTITGINTSIGNNTTALAGKVNTSSLAAASGVATLDSGSKLVQNVDAAKVNSGVLAVAQIPSMDAAKITTGAFAAARIPSLDATKVTTGVFAIAQIPNIDTTRIPSLDAAKVTTGTFALARIPTMDAAHIPAIDASKTTTGVFNIAQIPPIPYANITGAPASGGASQASVDALTAQQTALMAIAASIDEISVSHIQWGVWSAGAFVDTANSTVGTINQTLYSAPYAFKLQSFDVVREYGSQAASDTNYIQFSLCKTTVGGVTTTIAVKNTTTTSGEAMTNDKVWSFDGVTFDATNRLFNKGDILFLKTEQFGTGAMRFPATYTFRTSPL